MLDERRSCRRLGPKNARVLTMLLAAAISRSTLARGRFSLGTLTPLQKRLDLMLQLRNAPSKLCVLGFEFGNPLVAWVVHDPRSLRENPETGKSNCLTVTIFRGCATLAVGNVTLFEQRKSCSANWFHLSEVTANRFCKWQC